MRDSASSFRPAREQAQGEAEGSSSCERARRPQVRYAARYAVERRDSSSAAKCSIGRNGAVDTCAVIPFCLSPVFTPFLPFAAGRLFRAI